MIYLDHQASTPLHPDALAAMSPYLSGTYANPHSYDHAGGWAASAAVEAARACVAAALGCDPDEVVFTSGATEANNIALLGAAAAAGAGARVVVTSIEHKSVLAPARALARRGHEVVVVPVGADGFVRPEAVESAVAKGAAIVSVGAVNNEIGTVQPLAEIAAVCGAHGALLHSDATQALAWRGPGVLDLGVDLASFSSHKIGGPKGVGALFVSRTARPRIEPVQFGGEQEDGLRPGTLPTPLCVGFAAACGVLPDEAAVARWRSTTLRLLGGLREAFPDTRLNGAARPRHPGNLSVCLPGVEADVLIARLQPDVAVARGSACTSGMPELSHVLVAIGLDAAAAGATIRLSTGPDTTVDEVDAAVALIARAARRA